MNFTINFFSKLSVMFVTICEGNDKYQDPVQRVHVTVIMG